MIDCVWKEDKIVDPSEVLLDALLYSIRTSQIRSGLGRLRRRDRPPGYTIIEMAQQVDIDPQWIYRGIAKGRIEIIQGFMIWILPVSAQKAAVARMKQLKCGKVRQVIFRKEHGDD